MSSRRRSTVGNPGLRLVGRAVPESPRPAVIGSTTLPITTRSSSEPARRRRPPRRSGFADLAGAVVSATSLTSLAFGRLTPLRGRLGFVVVDFCLFLALFALLTAVHSGRTVVRDRLMTVLMCTAAALMFAGLLVIVSYTFWQGRSALSHWNFFTDDMSDAGPLDPLDRGGIAHAAVGTFEQLGVALLICTPLGLTCALLISEYPGRFSRIISVTVEAMTGLPDIIAGLFVYLTAILWLGWGQSGLCAALAISVIMLPVTIRTADAMLRLVPGSLREAAAALGAGRWRTARVVVLSSARGGLTTAVVMAAARGIGETAPLLVTAGMTASMNADVTSGPQVSLSLLAYSFVQFPEPAMIARGFGSATALTLLVFLLFGVARVFAPGGREPGRRQRPSAIARRRERLGSARHAYRIDAAHAERALGNGDRAAQRLAGDG